MCQTLIFNKSIYILFIVCYCYVDIVLNKVDTLDLPGVVLKNTYYRTKNAYYPLIESVLLSISPMQHKVQSVNPCIHPHRINTSQKSYFRPSSVCHMVKEITEVVQEEIESPLPTFCSNFLDLHLVGCCWAVHTPPSNFKKKQGSGG